MELTLLAERATEIDRYRPETLCALGTCLCLAMCMCIHVCVYVCVYARVCVCVCMRVRVYICVCVCKYLYTNILKYIFTVLHHIFTGNLYTMRGEHENAVTHFKLATRINHTNLSAWILLGHSYIELRNPTLAIEAYTRALGELYDV